MDSRVYEGRMMHRRLTPAEHVFSYPLFQMYLDLDELDEVFRGRWLWSTHRCALAWFRRQDHVGAADTPLRETICRLVSNACQRQVDGPIRLLTHLRYFGYCMNPVSFYYCFDRNGVDLEAVVAEVHNTPWNERHCYVLNCANAAQAADGSFEFRFDKAFHVSPFMAMDQQYAWTFSPPGPSLGVKMSSFADGERVFDATLRLKSSTITGFSLARSLARFPVMTGTVVARIYWQALKLKLKGVPFHAHPKHSAQSAMKVRKEL
ncbi:MAG: DUF1365 domain-containing protein [Gammaproteobacteria bacterium]|nr:DUF1365 domain-containing protein [Gammaproteobacteria bacterium]